MGREKRKSNHYGLCCAAVISTLLTACGVQGESPEGLVTEEQEDVRELGETYHCSVQELNAYLIDYATDCPYVSADIIISGYSAESPDYDFWKQNTSFTGDAEVIWQSYNSLEQMESELQAQEIGAETDEAFRLSYYAFPCPENLYALDLYYALKERYDSKEHPFAAVSFGNGGAYQFTQKTCDEDGTTHLYPHKAAINLIIKKGIIYGFTAKNIPAEYTDDELKLLFCDFSNYFDEHSYLGWYLDEERLYWIDHEERIIEMDGPDRSFVEIRGIDTKCVEEGKLGVMRYFTILKEADYEVPLTEDGSILNIHFTFAKEPLDEGYRYFLWDGRRMDEDYYMTVTDQETGKVLQESTVQLSIELLDAVTFTDLNADGYADMRIDKPSHSSGERVVSGPWFSQDYLLWNPQTEQFEYKTGIEVQNSLLANQNGLTKEGSTEYIVQPGDCLWSISERFLGSGYYWTKLLREESAPEDPGYILPGEIIYIPEKN